MIILIKTAMPVVYHHLSGSELFENISQHHFFMILWGEQSYVNPVTLIKQSTQRIT